LIQTISFYQYIYIKTLFRATRDEVACNSSVE
jgi:hypothetical protein